MERAYRVQCMAVPPYRPRVAAVMTPDPAASIEHLSVREIVAQICEDFGTAADLLGETAEAARITAIAAQLAPLLAVEPEAGVPRKRPPPGPTLEEIIGTHLPPFPVEPRGRWRGSG